jgi:hypothetical protein
VATGLVRADVHEIHAWAFLKPTDTASFIAGFNISSVTDNGTADVTATWAVPFAGASTYAVLTTASGNKSLSTTFFHGVQALTAGSVRTRSLRGDSGAATSDPSRIYLVALGEY